MFQRNSITQSTVDTQQPQPVEITQFPGGFNRLTAAYEMSRNRPPSPSGNTMTPEQVQAVQSQMNAQLQQSDFGRTYVPLLINPIVSITTAPTGPGALGTTRVNENNQVTVTLSQEVMERTYEELLASGLTPEQSIRLTALKMLPVYVHELQHARNDVAQIEIIRHPSYRTPSRGGDERLGSWCEDVLRADE